jgi:phosphatidylinositol alpha-1,6-mannosyltransferase
MLGAESLLPGNGGICRVARLVGKVLAEEEGAGLLGADAIALNDDVVPGGEFRLPAVRAMGGSRARFVVGMAVGAVGHTHFIYDFAGMARAHCRVPFLRRPMMVYLHGIEVWGEESARRIAVARRAQALVVNSAYTLGRAERDHGRFEVRPRVCWLATESDEASSVVADGGGPPTVMILARMDADGGYKGHRELIAAWPAVVGAVGDARLVIVGRGPGMEVIAKLVGESPVAGNIEMKGFVPDGELDRLWGRTAVFAMPSRGEGFGLVYIEAMRHGIPVIASVHDAAPEVNVDGETGYNVDLDRDGGGLAERVIYLLRNREVAAEMGRNGQRRWQEHFRYSAFRGRFRELLGDFLR